MCCEHSLQCLPVSRVMGANGRAATLCISRAPNASWVLADLEICGLAEGEIQLPSELKLADAKQGAEMLILEKDLSLNLRPCCGT